ncbi:hypothetical protein BTS2_0540 [Bacillus sp. TS-2]|nr:hypothetical protein BTS2_0540 [Bacillus sp. TS-2]
MLQEVKDYLKITWDDEDDSLEKIINRGKKYLNGKAGVKLDFEEDSEETGLLLDYCRYAYNHSLEMFSHNFSNDLLNLALREGVKAREDAKKAAEANT